MSIFLPLRIQTGLVPLKYNRVIFPQGPKFQPKHNFTTSSSHDQNSPQTKESDDVDPQRNAIHRMKVFLQAKEFKKVNEIFEEMKRKGIERNAISYQIEVKAAVQERGNGRRIWNLLDQMKTRGIPASVYLYNQIFATLKKNEDQMLKDKSSDPTPKLAEPSKHKNSIPLRGTKKKRISPKLLDETSDSETFSISKLFQRMEREGISPNFFSYKYVLMHFADQGQHQNVLQMLGKMEPQMFRIILFETIIQSYVHQEKLKEVDDIIQFMKEKEIKPSHACFEKIASYHEAKGQIKEVLDTLEKLMDAGLVPNTLTYTSVVEILRKADKVDEMLKILDRMKKEDIKMNEYTYTCVIQALTSRGDVTKAKEYYAALKDQNLRINHVTAALLICSMGKVKDWEGCWKILQDLKETKAKPSYLVYHALVNVAGACGKPDQLAAIAREFMASGMEPNVPIYNAMISALGRNRKVVRAKLLLDLMKSKNMIWDAEPCRIFVMALQSQPGLIPESKKLLAEALLKSLESRVIGPLNKKEKDQMSELLSLLKLTDKPTQTEDKKISAN